MEYVRTVPRHLVHRHAVAEVFVTDYRFEPEAAYEVGIQLPPAHRIFDTSSGHHDPLSVAEAFRQAVVLLCHTRYHIPSHHSLLMETFSLNMLGSHGIPTTSAPLAFDLTVNKLSYRDDAVSGVDVSGTLSDGSKDIARCNAVARGVSPDGYRRIRRGRENQYPSRRTTPPGSVTVRPGRVGRLSEPDVLISANDARRVMFCDPDPQNSALLDHPVDHIPGMVVFEAARQAVRYRSGNPAAQIHTLSAVFPQFTEWETPCEISTSVLAASAQEPTRYCIRFTQDDALTAELELSVEDRS
ncbi:hypothetical protein A2J03_25300 [Rhodococcus sp. EPR-157]|nr:ScbA/BarX family gamma-butyrolactone biosynthesis protein [Rhodococcus sp. EPR-157]KZF06151.1 hypothetical protein A2J03_25300 [Rhodococcus sp. EPR-157]